MANKHYAITGEYEVNLTVTVKLKAVSNHEQLTQDEIADHIEDAVANLKTFLENKLKKDYYNQEELTTGVDYWNFEVV